MAPTDNQSVVAFVYIQDCVHTALQNSKCSILLAHYRLSFYITINNVEKCKTIPGCLALLW